MLTVHHLNQSRSQRILWLLEELEVPYEITHYQRDPKTLLAPPELIKVHPLGKSPVITDGENRVAESGAIIEYLLERYGHGRFAPPAGTPDRLRYTYWLHYAEGSLMPLLVMKLVFSRLRTAPMPFFIRPVAKGIVNKVEAGFLGPNLKTHMDFVESELGRSTWFAGETFTAADIQMSFPVEAALARAGQHWPKAAAFLERCKARPAYQRAIHRGGPNPILG